MSNHDKIQRQKDKMRINSKIRIERKLTAIVANQGTTHKASMSDSEL